MGRRHHSSAIKIEVDMFRTGQKFLFGKCVQCNRKKPRTVSDNTTQARGIRYFFHNSRIPSAEADKKLPTNVMKNPEKHCSKTWYCFSKQKP